MKGFNIMACTHGSCSENFCPNCGAELKKKEESRSEETSRFNPKVGEVYQTDGGIYKLRIVDVNVKSRFPICILYSHKDKPEIECVTTLGLSGTFQGSKLTPYKIPQTKTVYVHLVKRDYSNSLETCTHGTILKGDMYIGRKRVTVTEGEFDD